MADRPADEIDIDGLADSYPADLAYLVRFFRRRGVPYGEADDLAQETVLRALVHLKRHGRQRDDLAPLMRTIARNLLIERVRRSAPVTVSWSDGFDFVDSAATPEDAAVDAERRDAVRVAISSLTPRHRRAVDLWIGGRTPAEIARELGIKRNAADAILHRARRSLAAKLDHRLAGTIVPVIFLRVRAQAKRVTDIFSSLDPSGAAAQAAGGLALAGTMVLVGMTGGSNPTPDPSLVPASAVVTGAVDAVEPQTRSFSPAADKRGREGEGPAGTGEEAGFPVVIDLSNHSGSAELGGFTDSDGTFRSFSTSWWIERDESGDRGIIEHVIDDISATVCGSLAPICDELAVP